MGEIHEYKHKYKFKYTSKLPRGKGADYERGEIGADWGIELISSVRRASRHVLIWDRQGYRISGARISVLELVADYNIEFGGGGYLGLDVNCFGEKKVKKEIN